MIYMMCICLYVYYVLFIHIFIFIHFVHISAAMGWVLSVGAAQPLPMETWYIHKCTIYILIFTCTSYISIQICKYIHAHIDLNWHPCFKLPKYQGFQTCAANRVWLWCKEAEISAMLISCPGFSEPSYGENAQTSHSNMTLAPLVFCRAFHSPIPLRNQFPSSMLNQKASMIWPSFNRTVLVL